MQKSESENVESGLVIITRGLQYAHQLLQNINPNTPLDPSNIEHILSETCKIVTNLTEGMSILNHSHNLDQPHDQDITVKAKNHNVHGNCISAATSEKIRTSKRDRRKIVVQVDKYEDIQDKHIWRKYGQKNIKGQKYPRSYFNCSHKQVLHCPAKMRVQRRRDESGKLEVTFIEDHICGFVNQNPPPQDLAIPTSMELATHIASNEPELAKESCFHSITGDNCFLHSDYVTIDTYMSFGNVSENLVESPTYMEVMNL